MGFDLRRAIKYKVPSVKKRKAVKKFQRQGVDKAESTALTMMC
jgi:hypothetical protein